MYYSITIIALSAIMGALVQVDPTDVVNMFPKEELKVFGAFSLVITALLWFIGYLILQVRSYKRMYLNEVKYNKEMSEAEAERSRLALQTMEKVRQTMEAQMNRMEQNRAGKSKPSSDEGTTSTGKK